MFTAWASNLSAFGLMGSFIFFCRKEPLTFSTFPLHCRSSCYYNSKMQNSPMSTPCWPRQELLTLNVPMVTVSPQITPLFPWWQYAQTQVQVCCWELQSSQTERDQLQRHPWKKRTWITAGLRTVFHSMIGKAVLVVLLNVNVTCMF